MRRELKIDLTEEELTALLDEQSVLRKSLVQTIDDRGGVIEVGAEEVYVTVTATVPPSRGLRYECDCGRVYRERISLLACQTRNHGELPNPPSRREDMIGESQKATE